MKALKLYTISEKHFIAYAGKIFDVVDLENFSFCIVDPMNNNLKLAYLIPIKPYMDMKEQLNRMEDDYK